MTITSGPARGDRRAYEQNYERAFGGRKHGARAVCSECGEKLRRHEVGLCAMCRATPDE